MVDVKQYIFLIYCIYITCPENLNPAFCYWFGTGFLWRFNGRTGVKQKSVVCLSLFLASNFTFVYALDNCAQALISHLTLNQITSFKWHKQITYNEMLFVLGFTEESSVVLAGSYKMTPPGNISCRDAQGAL